ncbi:MAG: CopD family protein, partial [Polynucleobacter victoriensis]
GYHHACGSIHKKFKAGINQRSHVWYRWFNELPVVIFLIVSILVVVKPF